jgi:hypothetical protein
MELPRGARVGEVERVSDELLGELVRSAAPDTRSDARLREGRGVTERRLPLESLELGPVARRFADQALERRVAVRREVEREHRLDPAGRRGRERDAGQSIGIGRGRDLGQTGLGLGLGLGLGSR